MPFSFTEVVFLYLLTGLPMLPNPFEECCLGNLDIVGISKYRPIYLKSHLWYAEGNEADIIEQT